MKNYAAATVFSIYETPAGFGALAANDAGLVAHHLPFGAASALAALELVATFHPQAKGESSLTLTGARLLARYFAGEQVAFDLPLQLGAFTPFRQKVLRMPARRGRGPSAGQWRPTLCRSSSRATGWSGRAAF